MNKKPSLFQRMRAKLNALNEAQTVVYTEFRNGDYFVILVPTWKSGRLYYRFVSWTRFHDRAGLPIMSNFYRSASCGMASIFAAALAELV